MEYLWQVTQTSSSLNWQFPKSHIQVIQITVAPEEKNRGKRLNAFMNSWKTDATTLFQVTKDARILIFWNNAVHNTDYKLWIEFLYLLQLLFHFVFFLASTVPVWHFTHLLNGSLHLASTSEFLELPKHYFQPIKESPFSPQRETK